ncbi:MAG: SMP-30/gluconolactonase/LRE family protein [Burkholderiales bacterium]|nr:SMP-30/gluconolactonase/LRE family protein [Burkholderiales bacterium]
MMIDIECVVQSKDRLGESPVWSTAEHALYWVDSRGPSIRRFDPRSGATATRAMPDVIGSIGLRSRGGLVVATQTGFHTLDRLDGGEPASVVDPEAHLPENRFNDGRCDRRGRFWAGTMNDHRRDPTGALYRLDPDARCTRIRDDIIVPNSIAWSPDDTIMYLADTYRGVILAYDFAAADGTIANPRPFVDSFARGRPDGSTVDADGCLWNAEYAGRRVVRYTPRGKVDRVIEMPVSQPTSCCFGGANLDVLYITSATQRLSAEQLAAEPLAGCVFACSPGVRGLPEPAYGG